ncbi:MAG: PAS domain S-box protein [Bacteroidetes bacterium]|nr:PAS domain S-box protein [Bacteroidota bacterium]
MDEKKKIEWLNEQLNKLHQEVSHLRIIDKKLKKVEEELNLSQNSFRNIIYELPFPAEVFDPSGYNIIVNRAFLEMCRIPSEELIINKYNILKNISIKKIGIEKEVKAVFSGEIIILPKVEIKFDEFRKKFGVQRKDEALFELTMFPVYNSKGKIHQVVAIWKDITQLYHEENQLHLLVSALNASVNGIIITNKAGNIIWVNEAFAQLTGFNKYEVFGKNPKILKSGKQDKDFYKKLWDTILDGHVWKGEIVNKKKNGTIYTEYETITPIINTNGEAENFIAVKTDLTELKKNESELKKLNRALKTISACNSVLIHSTSESELVKEICRIIIEVGEYYFTWIGLLDSQPEKFIDPAASFGYDEGYLNILISNLKENKNIISPLLKAINEKKIQITKNISESNEFSPWKGEAIKRGYSSVVVLPLINTDNVLGVLCIYSNIVDAFNQEEIPLLEELANDLSYGLNVLRINSERKKTEEELRKSEKLYRSLFEEDIAGHYISTPGGRITNCNPAFLKIFGFNSLEEAKRYNSVKLHSSPEARLKFIERLKKEKKIENYESFGFTADGKQIYTIENVWGSFNENGDLTEIKGYLHDISKRKIAELALRESELKYRELVENINEVIYSIDLNWNITYISPAIIKFSGYSPEELIGKAFSKLISQQGIQLMKKNFNAALLGNNESNECRIITKLGVIRWVKYSGHPILRENKIIGLQGVLTDITELKEIEENLILAKEKAEEADKMKSEFLAQMSHEIRTPINIMLSYNSLIKDELSNKIDGEWHSAFNSIELAGKRLIRTIDLILNMSMIQSGKIEINLTKVDIYYTLLHLVHEFSIIAEEKNLEVSLSKLVDDMIINSDEYIVSQVFQNLIDNAIKYTKSGKVEIILYRDQEDKLCVDIKDTGIGISQKYLAEMFKPFSQEDTGYARRYEGVGLGLALVKNYLNLLNAEIFVKSEKGKGSVFTVTFN